MLLKLGHDALTCQYFVILPYDNFHFYFLISVLYCTFFGAVTIETKNCNEKVLNLLNTSFEFTLSSVCPLRDMLSHIGLSSCMEGK